VDKLLTLPEVVGILGMSRSTIWRMCLHGGLPHFKFGRTLRFDESKLRHWLSEHDPTEAQARPE
jgi:excisionase family DNA binding protein